MILAIDASIPFARGAAEQLADEVIYVPSGEWTAEHVADAELWVVRSVDRCTAELMAASRVRCIATATIGYDHIDVAYCDARHIRWSSAPGCNADSVALYVLASMITLAQRHGFDLRSRRLGIVGVGHVGQAVARICAAYGIETLHNDPPRALHEEGFCAFSELAQQCDMLTIHTPLTHEGDFPTHHMVDRAWLESLERRPYLINAARGAVVDSAALAAALAAGQIAGAVIDCWEHEPTIDRQLLAMTALATPHIAGFSYDGKANATRMALEAVADYLGRDHLAPSLFAPPAPLVPLIDLAQEGGVEAALLHAFDPTHVDVLLRSHPERFEALRQGYDHPREPHAYRVVGASADDARLLSQLGFRCS